MKGSKLAIVGTELDITPDRANYVYLYKIFSSLANKAADDFELVYYNHNMSTVLNHGFSIIDTVINKAIYLLISKDVSDISKSSFLSKYYLRLCNWWDYFYKVNDKYMDLVCTPEELTIYNMQRRDNCLRMKGVAYGLEDTLSSDAFNLALQLAHCASGPFFDMAKASVVYEQQWALDTFKEGIYHNVFMLMTAVINVFKSKKLFQFCCVTPLDRNKARALVEHFGKVKNNSLIIAALNLDPFNIEIYRYIIKNDLDKGGNIVKLADYFGVCITSILEDRLLAYLPDRIITQKHALSLQQDIINYMEVHNINSSVALDSINAILAEMSILLGSFYDVNNLQVEDLVDVYTAYISINAKLQPQTIPTSYLYDEQLSVLPATSIVGE
ncbi:MAG: hypothetical protein ATN34_03165 [Epulopiscium sp. Nele67-Bin002]|nr:MAG: hypothetical protein ATN34_03165 [Epulopiscium sp. Nele67-Bin002]